MSEVALAIVHDSNTDKVLLIKRSRATDFSGWAFPGGKLEKLPDHRRESAVDAARRELVEETGLCPQQDGHVIFRRRHPATGANIRYVYFATDGVVKADNIEADKSDDCVWVSLDNVERLFTHGLVEGLRKGIRKQLAKQQSTYSRAPAC